MSHARFDASAIPDQSGRVIVVTGANSGIGLEATRMLAGAGAHVVMACRSAERAATARDGVLASHPDATVDVMALDLADLASVAAFAGAFHERFDRLDVLVNNAGVMALPYRTTADGFEMQFGTNHLGHFALTGRLFGRLRETPGARVVTVSSLVHRVGRMRWDDLDQTASYSRWGAYAMSKLSNLLFTYELARRSRAARLDVTATACHPGYSATNLQFVAPRMDGGSFTETIMSIGNATIAQSAAMGALPTVYAATAPDVASGDYIGPGGLGEWRGYPKKVGSSAASRDEAAAARLWAVSEERTGVSYLPAS